MSQDEIRSLDKIERGKYFCKLIIEKNLSYTMVSKETGMSVSHVQQTVKLIEAVDTDLYKEARVIVERIMIKSRTENARKNRSVRFR